MPKDGALPSASHFRQQVALLERSQRTGEHLADVLARAGWSYDDLIYENSRTREWRGERPLPLAELQSADRHARFVSFFSGCGGMDLGLEAAGFQHLAGFEINDVFCKTLRRNRPTWKIFGPPTHSGDVSNFGEVVEALRGVIRAPFDGLFVGGPPCQPFSIAANQRFAKWGDNFKRVGFAHEKNGNLLFDFVRLILEFNPEAFAIENVPGLRDIDGGHQLAAAIGELKAGGYRMVEPFVLDASRYGVPQERFRLFLLGTRTGGQFRRPVPYLVPTGAGSVLAGGSPALPNNETREHLAGSILRYMRLDYGQREQLGRVDRLDPAVPSKTVIAGGTNGGGRSHLHPEIPRTLSVRECAMLQTFPDDFVFMGASARQFTQVGNAVPPVLAAQVGRAIGEAYF